MTNFECWCRYSDSTACPILNSNVRFWTLSPKLDTIVKNRTFVSKIRHLCLKTDTCVLKRTLLSKIGHTYPKSDSCVQIRLFCLKSDTLVQNRTVLPCQTMTLSQMSNILCQRIGSCWYNLQLPKALGHETYRFNHLSERFFKLLPLKISPRKSPPKNQSWRIIYDKDIKFYQNL